MFGRIRNAVGALRPRVVAQLQKAVGDLSAQAQQQRSALKQLQAESASGHRAIHDTLESIQRDLRAAAERQQADASATTEALAAVTRELAAVSLRESQLRAIATTDVQLDGDLVALDRLLAEPEAIRSHVRAAIARAGLRQSPFMHAVVDDLLPPAVFDALVTGLPPAVLFADRPVNHQHLKPPFALAPRYSRRIWGFMADVLIHDFIRPAVLEKFRDGVADWFGRHFPALDASAAASMTLTCSDGRILLRRRGYEIPPHRDPKWAVITCLLYLPRPGDDERWGTQLYTVADDDEAQGAKPHWIAPERCTLAGDVPFRPNRMLVFVNAIGAHGALIPDDAEPADLERYAYQFRIGPDGGTMRRLVATLPEQQRMMWAGKTAAEY